MSRAKPEIRLRSSCWRTALTSVLCGFGIVLQFAAGIAAATAHERLQITRTVDFTSINWDGEDHGRLDIEVVGVVDGGKFIGNATVAINWLWVDPTRRDLSGFHNVNGAGAVTGSIDGDIFRMTVDVPVRGKFSSLLGELLGIPFCLTRPVEFRYDGDVMAWGSFDVELDKLTHDSTVRWSSTEGGTVVLDGTVRTVVQPADAAPGTEVDFASSMNKAPFLKDLERGGRSSSANASAGLDGGYGVVPGGSVATELIPFIRYQLVRPPRKETE